MIKLGPKALEAIVSSIASLFDKLRARLLGPSLFGKKVNITYHHDYSLPGLIEAAGRETGVKTSADTVSQMLKIADNYITAYESVAKAKVLKEVHAFLSDAQAKGVKTDVKTVLGGQWADVWKDVSNSVHQLVDSEATTAKNMTILEGIERISQENGIDDPVVYFVVVRDNALCDSCHRLHLMGDNKTPRLWYISELTHGYGKKDDKFPCAGPRHPHCRCVCANMPPDYGFDSAGMIEYKRPGYSAIKVQRKILSEPT
jgi:hypothetical protein